MREVAITQADALQFVRDRWPHRLHPEARALKLGEECGEVQGAVTKWLEGRDTIDHIGQEAAQAVIVAMSLAESVGFDLADEIDKEWGLMPDRVFPAVTFNEQNPCGRCCWPEDCARACIKSEPGQDKEGA